MTSLLEGKRTGMAKRPKAPKRIKRDDEAPAYVENLLRKETPYA